MRDDPLPKRGATGLLACMAVGIACTLALGLGCGGRKSGRVLIIGIDGASPVIAGPMLKEGRLPNLKRIADEGVSGRIRSVLPLYSPRIWATIATGRKPADHGIVAFVKKSDAAEKQLYLSHDRRVPALWNILSNQGHSVGVVNWWTTFPPEKLDGVMVSDHFFPEQIEMIKRTFKDDREMTGSLVYPESFAERAEALVVDRSPLTAIPDPFNGDIKLPHWINTRVLSGQFETDSAITRVAMGIEADFGFDVTMVFLPGIDRISHWLWGNLEPAIKYPPTLRPKPDERVGGAEALRVYYEYTDRLIGLLSAEYGPDDLVLVISDHGFEAGVSLMLLTGEHETPAALDGVIFARGPGITPGSSPGRVNVFDVAPTILAWLGIPIAEDMVGRPAPFLLVDDPGKVASYDDITIERLDTGESATAAGIVEHLRALGYLEEADAEADATPSDPQEAASP